MTSKITRGKLEGGRDEGIGSADPAMIRERATELAAGDGRTEDEVTSADLEQAERELAADLHEGPVTEPNIAPGASTAAGDPPASTGGQTSPTGFNAEPSGAEKLVHEGIEEAVHDEFVESGKETLDAGETEDEPPDQPERG